MLNLGPIGQPSGSSFTMNQGVSFESKQSAVLFVFRPYANQFLDVAHRPMNYRFDESFLQGMQQLSEDAKRPDVREKHLLGDFTSKMNMSDYMMPSAQPAFTLRTSALQDCWRFVLILTETSGGLRGSNTTLGTGNSMTRRIYTGFFDQEPFNPNTFSSTRQTLNPHAIMTITHKTVVGTRTEPGRLGGSPVLSHFGSEEIVHPEINRQISAMGNDQGGLHLMTPENCLNSVEYDSQSGMSMVMPGLSTSIDRETNAQIVSEVFQQPALNVEHVVRGVIKYQDEMGSRNLLSSRRNTGWLEEYDMDDTANRNRLARHFGIPRQGMNSPFDLDVDSRISAADLDARLSGEIDVQSIDLVRPEYSETMDQGEQSAAAMMSYLLATVIPAVVSQAGLNQMKFIYQVMKVRGIVEDDFRCLDAKSTWPTSGSDLLARSRAIESELKYGVFRTILETAGDFYLEVDADVTGFTSVSLSLVGRGHRCFAPFELPSMLGGIITPIIGDTNSTDWNGQAIQQMYQIATGGADFADIGDGISFTNPGNLIQDFRNSHDDASDEDGVEYD